ncbi:MAG: DUF1684 domain-containing protein [Ignavibacteriae bacterium]|nr:DUF1684 domain-containing protein [Ignavibacteriota bacterium]
MKQSLILLIVVSLASCGKKPERITVSPQDSVEIARDNVAYRAEVEVYMRDDPGSPFGRDTTIKFHGLHWFPIDPRYRVSSVLHKYEDPETVVVLGTKGEERKQLRYGYFEFVLPDEQGNAKPLRINVYKFTPYDTKRYALYKDNLSVWFTDSTTSIETYGVGRYVEVGNEHPDPSHVYSIDFNKAYNPYCAYSNLFSCAIPRKEDRLEIALHAGEKNYHE